MRGGVVELERSHPDTIAHMLLVAHTVFSVNDDGIGILKSSSSGRVRPTTMCQFLLFIVHEARTETDTSVGVGGGG